MTIIYRDVSHYDAQDGNYSYNEAGVILGKDHPYVMAKATEGTTYVDPMYHFYKEWCNNHSLWFAAYHFLHHGDGAAEAQYAHNYVVNNVGLMLDVELEKASVPTVQDVLDFVKEYRSLGGRVHLYYLPHWYWQGWLGSPDLTVLEKEGLYLVSSDYTDYSDTGPGWQSYGGVTPAVWQYQGGPDLDAFKGTLQDLERITVQG